MEVRNVAVIGAGTMGASIAWALAEKDCHVLLMDVKAEFLESGLKRIDRFVESRVKKGLSPEQAQSQRQAIETAMDYDRLKEVDLVIEAVSEDIDIKRNVFQNLEKYCRPDAILGSNTSSLSITRIGAFTKSPERVVGLHFFNPAHLMKLVEVIPGLETSASTVDAAMQFVSKLGKLPVRVDECASFLVNRLLGRYMNESLFCLQDGVASVEEIDEAVVNYVMPVGPLALRDMNGADIGLAVANFNYGEYGDRFLPPAILKTMVEKNLLGEKTGKGFYLYDPDTKKRTGPNPAVSDLTNASVGNQTLDVERLFLPMINEAFLVLQERVCALEDLDPALKAGLGMRKGPLELASDMGLEACLKKIEELFQRHGERFRPAPLLKRYVWSGRQKI